MTHHRIVWTLVDGRVRGEVYCDAPVGADCRLVGGPGCECESWNIERDDEGPFHGTAGYDDGDNESEVRHAMVDGDCCNVCEWLNEDEGLLDADGDIEIGVTPIVPVWHGDYYTWTLPTEEQVSP